MRNLIALLTASFLLLIVSPLAVGLLIWVSRGPGLHFGDSIGHAALLAFTGIVTALPLTLFSFGARRLSFTALGPMQFATPSLQFLLAISFGETVTPLRWISFGVIWLALIIFMWDALARERARRRLATAASPAA